MTTFTVLVICTATAYWLYKHKLKSKPGPSKPQRSNTVQHQEKNYKAASVSAGPCACAAARDVADIRFLANHAPRIPLAGCDSQDCQCKYVHHDDRRVLEDRRALYGLETDLYIVAGNKEQRASNHRRSTDGADCEASDLRYEGIDLSSETKASPSGVSG